MKRKIIKSGDGTPTIYVESLDEHYHSVHGARAESEHIFIDAGLKNIKKEELNILEIGFGTGLNAYLTLNNKNNHHIHYYTIEKYPLEEYEWKQLDYINEHDPIKEGFAKIHQANWEKWVEIEPGFKLFKKKADLKNFTPPSSQDLIYFDAFAPDVQPELWSREIFKKLYECLARGDILVTYSVKGFVRRNLIDCGFILEKMPGPKGKRHMLRARK